MVIRTRLPSWFRQSIPDERTTRLLRRVREENLHTVCAAAHCPNVSECCADNHLTFMILGESCTRHCHFCAVKKTETPAAVDPDEPERLARLIADLRLQYVVLTSVTRDDLPDGGAEQFCRCVAAIRARSPETRVELLVPDFQGNATSITAVAHAGACVIAHNLETVPRLYARIRPDADYQRSLELLRLVKQTHPAVRTKSALMVGLGELTSEVEQAFKDLRSVGCDMIVIGQYLAPSPDHALVAEYVDLEQFKHYETLAYRLGFSVVTSAPKARSSYQAERIFERISPW